MASLDARARAVSETFFDIAADVYGISEVADPAQLLAQLESSIIERHEMASDNFIKLDAAEDALGNSVERARLA